ncbi:hypothetical protein ES705_46285 [subsurface metagenome]
MAKGPFMEFLRAIVTQTAINTFAEVQIPTPTSKTENMAMLIHSIQMQPNNLVDTTPTNLDTVSVQMSKVSKTGVKFIHDPDILAFYQALTNLDTVYNGVTFKGHEIQTFDPPILYPHANLYFGIYTVGLTNVEIGRCRIGYTLEKVSREDFISALVE